MRIKTRLAILLFVAAAVLIASLAGTLLADFAVEKALKSSQKAYNIVNEVSQINRLGTEISFSGLPRIQQQWQWKMAALRKAIGEYEGDPETVRSMSRDLDQLDPTFRQLQKIIESESTQGSTANFSRAKFYSRNYLTVLLHALSSKANRIATENNRSILELQSRKDTFLIVISIVWCLIAVLWVMSLWRGIMYPIRSLIDSIGIVASGDLNHRIPAQSNSHEMDNLIHSFNDMLDRLQDLTASRQKILEATEKERARIGREMHDGISQTIVGIRLKLNNLPGSVDTHKKQLSEVDTHLKAVQKEIQRIVSDLRPAILDGMGLTDTLIWFGKEYSNGVSIVVDVAVKEKDIPKNLRTPIFRIVQEATNNAITHGKASTIHIQLTRQGGVLDLFIEDDGSGFYPAKIKYGNGLINIRERTQAFHGEVSIDAMVGKGCCIIASFPIREEGEGGEGDSA